MIGRQLHVGAIVLALLAVACAGETTTTTPSPETVAQTTTSTAPPTVAPTSTTTIAPTTTSTLSQEDLDAIQYEEDVKAITTLFRRFSDSWFGGIENAYTYTEEHNYPAEGCTADDFAADNDDLAEGFQLEEIVDQATIERDDGWVIPGGAAIGTTPDGRIYIFSLTSTNSAPDQSPSTVVSEVHATVRDDGMAYFFRTCGKT